MSARCALAPPRQPPAACYSGREKERSVGKTVPICIDRTGGCVQAMPVSHPKRLHGPVSSPLRVEFAGYRDYPPENHTCWRRDETSPGKSAPGGKVGGGYSQGVTVGPWWHPI